MIWELAEGNDPDNTVVSTIMTSEILTCFEDKTIEDAADKMSVGDVRRLVVLDNQENVVGVLSTVDMLKCTDSNTINDDILHHLSNMPNIVV